MEKLYESLGISRPVLDFAGEILDGLKVTFVETMSDVLKEALCK